MTTPAQPSKGSKGSLRRTAVGLVALAALWNALYWLWPPHREPPVVLAGVSEESDTEPPGVDPEATRPEPAPPVVLTMGSGGQTEDVPPQIVDPILHDPAEQRSIVAPQFRAYEVAQTDRTLGDIAERFYGDEALAHVIAQANPFKDPRRLTAGQVWRVPLDPDNIQGLVVDGQGNPVDTSSTSRASDEHTTYVVQANDTFGAISKRFYDTTRHAESLYDYNRQRLGLRSIRSLRPGQVLHIPNKPK